MSDESKSVRDQIDESVIAVRNEAIVQTANAYTLGRKLVLVSLGATMLVSDQVQALLQRALERGELVERDAGRKTQELQQKASDGTAKVLSSGVASVLNKAPGINLTYDAPTQPETPPTDAPAQE
ncbi:MAG: hypothetical protein IPK16_14640 [Anaerolineales bacterium]|nr:hypothetical protein [Anaerolineales bacterium]